MLTVVFLYGQEKHAVLTLIYLTRGHADEFNRLLCDSCQASVIHSAEVKFNCVYVKEFHLKGLQHIY